MSRFAPHLLDLSDDVLMADFLEFALLSRVRRPQLSWLQTADGSVMPSLCELTDPPDPMTLSSACDVVTALCDIANHFGGTAGLLLVWQRPGPTAPGDSDTCWVEAARRACAESGVVLHGVWFKGAHTPVLRLDSARLE